MLSINIENSWHKGEEHMLKFMPTGQKRKIKEIFGDKYTLVFLKLNLVT